MRSPRGRCRSSTFLSGQLPPSTPLLCCFVDGHAVVAWLLRCKSVARRIFLPPVEHEQNCLFLPQRDSFCMVLPGVLQQFHCLDESSPCFPDPLTNLPHEKEYKHCTRKKLPQSCMLESSLSGYQTTSADSGDKYQGSLNGSWVQIKRLHVYTKKDIWM